MQIHANSWASDWSHWKVAYPNIIFLYVIPFLAAREESSCYVMCFRTSVITDICPLWNQWQNELLISAQLGFYHRGSSEIFSISYSEKFEVRWSDYHSSSLFWSLKFSLSGWLFKSFQALKKNCSAKLMRPSQSFGTQVSLP